MRLEATVGGWPLFARPIERSRRDCVVVRRGKGCCAPSSVARGPAHISPGRPLRAVIVHSRGTNTPCRGTRRPLGGDRLVTRRLVDIVLAGIGLAVSLPVTIAAAALIFVVNPGPVIYRADRVGRSGRIFTMYKLRTMYQRKDDSGSVVTAAGDGRVFPVGRLLRRWKVDELPQMINIIKGDMSIVGPRPRDPRIVRRCYTPLHRETLDVLPGLTSPGTLFYLAHGEPTLRSGDPEGEYQARILPQKLALDVDYVRNRSVWIDVWMVVRTVGAIFNLRPARLGLRHVERVKALVQPARNMGGEVDPTPCDAAPNHHPKERRNGDQESLRGR